MESLLEYLSDIVTNNLPTVAEQAYKVALINEFTFLSVSTLVLLASIYGLVWSCRSVGVIANDLRPPVIIAFSVIIVILSLLTTVAFMSCIKMWLYPEYYTSLEVIRMLKWGFGG